MPVNYDIQLLNCRQVQYVAPGMEALIKFSPMKIILQDEVLVFLLTLKESVMKMLPKSQNEEKSSNKKHESINVEVTEAYKDQMKRIDHIIAVKIELELEELKILLIENNQELAGIMINTIKLQLYLGSDGDMNGELTLGRFDVKDCRDGILLNKVVSNPLLENEPDQFLDAESEILQIKGNFLMKPKSDLLDIGLYINDMRIIASADFFMTILAFFSSPIKRASTLLATSVPEPIPQIATSKYTTTFNTRVILQLTNFEF